MERDHTSPESGGSVFNSRGQRVNEIDLDNRVHPQTIDEMTLGDWEHAEAALQRFDAGHR